MSSNTTASSAPSKTSGQGGLKGLMARVQRLLDWYQRSRVGRMMSRYSSGKGGLLAGGIAYTGLFSVFAALAIGVSVLMATIGRNPELREAVLNALDSMLPGVIKTSDSSSGLVTIDDLTVDSAINPASIIAFLTLLYTAMGFMGTLKTALRAMFGIVQIPENAIVNQLWNLVGFLIIMVGVVVTAVASIVTNTLSDVIDALPAWLSGVGAKLLTLGVSFLLDAVVIGLVITVCGIRPPRKDMLWGCALGGVAFGVLRQLGTSAVGSVNDNPLLASFAAIVVLILWLHLASRIILMVGAWMANPPRPRVIDHPDEVHAKERPNYVTVSVPETLTWPRQTLTGNLEVDPTENPDFIPPVPVEPQRGELREELGAKKGLRARRVRRRYEKAMDRARRAKEEYLEL